MTIPEVELSGSAYARLVFATGWLGASADFDAVRNALGHFPSAAYAPSGLAASSSARPWSLESSLAELESVLDGLPSAHIVVGSSASGCTALAAASRRELDGVIAIGAAPRWMAAENFPFGFTPEMANAVAQSLRASFAATVGEAMPAAYLDEADAATAARLRTTIVGRAATAASPEVLIQGLEESLSVDLVAELASIRCPVLLIGGERDHVVTPELLRWTAERIPRCEVDIIDGAAHLPHLTASVPVSRSIARFLSRIGGDA